MTFMIAAAGTGGHVYPGLSVGEALQELGVARDHIAYVGGSRLESKVYPEHGYPFVKVEVAGLRRSLALENVRLPRVVLEARRRISAEIETRKVKVLLGMGGYVTIPAGLAARRSGIDFFNAEQNAEAGLANRVSKRWARRSFVSFPATGGIPHGEWVGNPVRRMFWDYDRQRLTEEAEGFFGAAGDVPAIGVFGGSLGARAINEAVRDMATTWAGPDIEILHLTGSSHLEELADVPAADGVRWHRFGFTDRMDLFYAFSDLVIARAGGAVAELTATGTPTVLVPGSFGSAGHQVGNARFLEKAGSGLIVEEDDLSRLPEIVSSLISSPDRLKQMGESARSIAKPHAALTIARAMIEVTT